MAHEFSLINDIFAPLTQSYPSAFDLKDDAAVLSSQPNKDLVVTADTLVAGVHFFEDDSPVDIGHKALAVNLSDLAAKGATPKAYMLSIALPKTQAHQREWVQAFANGLKALQEQTGCSLIGGDTVTTSGPLTISITAFGETEQGGMIQRSSAQVGDHIYVTGTIGDAALGLQVRRQDSALKEVALSHNHRDFLLQRYLRPTPRLALGCRMKPCVHAAMDISDGLIGDLQKLCAASGVDAAVYLEKVPLSAAANDASAQDPKMFETLVTGGDDYELLVCVPPEKSKMFAQLSLETHTPVSNIGAITPKNKGVQVFSPSGELVHFAKAGFEHI